MGEAGPTSHPAAAAGWVHLAQDSQAGLLGLSMELTEDRLGSSSGTLSELGQPELSLFEEKTFWVQLSAG